MKKIILLLILVLNFTVYGQANDIIILVKDSKTDLVLPNVTILASEINKSGLTNQQGVLKVQVQQPVMLTFELPNYKTIYLHSSLFTERLNIVYLDSVPKAIEKTVVLAQTPYDVLTHLIENSMNVLTNPIALKVYFLEFYKKNSYYTSFNDGLLNFHISGKTNRIKTDIVVEQNRFYSLPEHNAGTNVFGYNLDKLILNNYKFSYLDLFLDKKTMSKYDCFFTISDTNTNHYKIKLQVKDSIKEALADFEIVYDYTKMLILHVELNISEQKIQFAETKKFDDDTGKLMFSNFKVEYKINDNLYYLSNSSEDIGIKMRRESGNIDDLEVKNYFIVNDVNTQSLNYNKKKVFKLKSLNKIKTKYYSNYWELNSELKLTDTEVEMLEALSSKISQ